MNELMTDPPIVHNLWLSIAAVVIGAVMIWRGIGRR